MRSGEGVEIRYSLETPMSANVAVVQLLGLDSVELIGAFIF